MAAETSHDVDVAAETSQSEEPKNGKEWVIKIMKEHRVQERKEEQEQPTKPLPRIPWVDETLRQTHSDNHCFEPLVVSFGPYHHGKEKLKPMEPYKKDAAAWFISHAKVKPADKVTDDDDEAFSVYEKFIEGVKNVSPTFWYDEGVFKSEEFKSEEHFIRMMFLDGCFILYFIHLVVTGSSSDEYIRKSKHYFSQASIVRDMFLLENQIPYPVLESLIKLLPADKEMTGSLIIKFIFMVFLPSYEMNFSRIGCFRVMIWILKLFFPPVWKLIFHSLWTGLFKGAGKEPLHLLHVLREVLLGVRGSPDSTGGSPGYLNYYFRPIRELKAAGIQVRRSRGMTLKHLGFKMGLLNSHLEIPQIIVDDSTRARLLNLVAYEMCPDGPKDRTVTSYICLLHSLIDHAEDVKELESEKILLNRLPKGEDVSKLFKELATNLFPDSNAYAHVFTGISKHYKRHFHLERALIGEPIGEWIRQFKRTYFTSPWTLTSLIAAVFVLGLTLLQTIYTIWAFYKT